MGMVKQLKAPLKYVHSIRESAIATAIECARVKTRDLIKVLEWMNFFA